jgi:hypothetical protein
MGANDSKEPKSKIILGPKCYLSDTQGKLPCYPATDGQIQVFDLFCKNGVQGRDEYFFY